MQEVVIAGYLRTAQSRSRPGDPGRDWFHKLRADELLAKLIPELLLRSGIDSDGIDDFLVGSAMGVSEQWTYGGRTPVFLANLSENVPAKFFDQRVVPVWRPFTSDSWRLLQVLRISCLQPEWSI